MCNRTVSNLYAIIGNLQDGSMRCDVNVSVAESIEQPTLAEMTSTSTPTPPADSESELEVLGQIIGNRVEVKNINSMQMVTDSAQYEINRHIHTLEMGGFVLQETRGYDDATGSTFAMRAKETAVDYRIFPDPDIPRLILTDEDISLAAGLDGQAMELPEVTSARLMGTYYLNKSQAEVLITQPDALSYFERASSFCKLSEESRQTGTNTDISPGDIFNWMVGDLQGNLNANYFDFSNSPVEPGQLFKVIEVVHKKEISALQGKKLLKFLFAPEHVGADPEVVMVKKGLKQISDEVAILSLVEASICDPNNEKKLDIFKINSHKRPGMESFFFGDVMKRSQGKANPQTVKVVLGKYLLDILN